MFLAAVAGLSPQQWRFKPRPERWSIAEIAEHLAVVEMALPVLMQARILTAEPITATLESGDLALQTRVAGRKTKAQAIELVWPNGRWQREEETIGAFCAAREKNIQYVQGTQDDLRHHTGAHPSLGVLDGYQWLLFLAAHTERHIAQIKELQDEPGWPQRAATAKS